MITVAEYRKHLSDKTNNRMSRSDVQVSCETIHEFGLEIMDMVEVDEIETLRIEEENKQARKSINSFTGRIF